MADFELIKVSSVSQLHENLTNLLKNKKHIDSIVVDTSKDEIRVDLSKIANAFNRSDFRLKLQTGKGWQAKTMIERLKVQETPSWGQSEELYNLLNLH